MHKISAKLLQKEELTHDVYQFDFDFGGEPFPFKAGQFFILNVEDGQEPPANRSYSIASPPSESKHFSLCVKLIPGGRASEVLRALEPGAHLNFMAPFGHFVLKEEDEKAIVMVATGTGLAPFMSMLPELFARAYQRPITLYFGVRHEEDLFYMDQLNAWAKEHENFTFIPMLSRPSETWKGAQGRVTEHFLNHDLDPEKTRIYICGGGSMVKEVKKMAEDKGVPKDSIHFELFTTL